jgi:hypothetical protein
MCCDLTTERGVRRATSALGVATFLFGLAPAVAPGYFARLVGMAAAESSPATLSVIRSVGIRDAVMGIGLLSAAMHGGRLGPWLMARTLMDAGDTLSVSLAFARGGGSGRLAALGGLAFAATIVDHALWHAARRVTPMS